MEPVVMTAGDHTPCGQQLTAALLPPIGRGAVATIRLQGDLDSLAARGNRGQTLSGQAISKSNQLPSKGSAPFYHGLPGLAEIPFRAANGKALSQQPVGRIVFGSWGQNSADSEDVVVCRVSPQALEIHCHGGDAAVRRILNDLQHIGCQVMDWTSQSQHVRGIFETECLIALSRATTWKTAEILYEQCHGLLRQSLSDLLNLSTTETELKSRLDELLRWSSLGIHLSQPWTVVLSGRPNVGKSSLINALLGYERAIVFDQPGTTRDVVTAETAFDGWPVQLTDTAGLRETSEELEAAGIALTRQKLEVADLRLILIDFSEPPLPDDEELLAEWPDAIVVAHKCDLTDQWHDRLPRHAIKVSSTVGTGLAELQSLIANRLVPHTPPPGTAIPVTQRQVDELKTARDAVSAGDFLVFRQAIERILG